MEQTAPATSIAQDVSAPVMSLSIIIPALNEEKMIGRCLESLTRLAFARDRFEVLVVDNGSRDRTLAIAESFKDRYNAAPDPLEQDKFTGWLMPLIGKVDVVMVHEPALIQTALTLLKDDPPDHPLVFLVGHTHQTDLKTQPGVTMINGGSIGAGGTGNLTETTAMSVARFVFTVKPSFQPLAADLVSIDPGTGSSSARRIILEPE